MRFLLFPLALAAPLAAVAGPPQLILQAALFRSLDQTRKTGEVELSATVATQGLVYRQRAPRSFQSSAVVDLSILKADGTVVWQETVAIKPPVLNDTTVALKNPVTFLRRVTLPDGTYTLRGRLRDQYHTQGGEATVEQPLAVAAPTGPAFSDILFLAKPAAPAVGQGVYNRGGYVLARAPGGHYGRGADALYFYTELNQLPAARPVVLHYHLEAPDGSAADADADPLTPKAGRPTPITGQLPLGLLPDGPFTLTIEARDAATQKLLTTQHQAGERSTTEYAPGGAVVPR